MSANGRVSKERKKTGASEPHSRGRRSTQASQVRRSKILTGSNLLLGIIGSVMIFCIAVFIVLNLRQIYYFDIKFLNLKKEVGLDDWIIQKNYDTLIDYNLITRQVKELKFPSFPMSESGRIHFEEVRNIFYGIQYAGLASIVFFLIGFAGKAFRKDYGCLRLIQILTIVLPAALGAAVAFCWEEIFVLFHKLLFRNDYWLFDPAADPVINILPDEFFMHCAAAILIFILFGSILCGMLYKLLTGRQYR